MGVSDLFSKLLAVLPGSKRWRIRSAWKVTLVVGAAIGIGGLATSLRFIEHQVTELLEGAASVKVIEEGRKGELEKVTYRFVASDDSRTWHISHTPPCDPHDANCFVALSIRQDSRAVKWIVGGAAGASFLVIVGLAVIVFSGKGRFGILFGHKLTLTHQMSVDASGAERCVITRKYEGLESDSEQLIVPVDLNYRYHTKNGDKIELQTPVLKSSSFPTLLIKPTDQSEQHFLGDVKFPASHRKDMSFELEFSVLRNFSKDLAIHQARWGNTVTQDNHKWTSAGNWTEVVLVFDWAPDFKIGGFNVEYRETESGSPQLIPAQGDQRVKISVLGKKWTITIPDVEYGLEANVVWTMLA